MFDYLIPNAYAQLPSASNAARAGANAAKEGGEAGVQGLFKFFFTNIDNWIAGVIVVVISYIIAKIIASGAKERIIKSKGGEVQESVLILVERVSKIVIVTIGVTIAFAINGLNFTAVIGALSLGIGFALKDTIANFISGMIMLAQDRIRIGDFIKVDDVLGTIVSIDTRATVLQAIDGTEVVIPNQNMLSQTLISYSTNPFRRIELIVGVDYKTDLPMVTSLIKGILDKENDVVPKPESLVLVDEFSDSAITIKVLFWIESRKNWMEIRSNIAYRIKKAFDELGINIPFPIRTLKLDEDDQSFLKTMDSLKKGIVPENPATPNLEAIQKTVEESGKATQIPYALFKKPAAPAAPKPKPQAEVPTPPPTSEGITQKPESPGTPPTHL